MTTETSAAPPDPVPYRGFDSRLQRVAVGAAACVAWYALLAAVYGLAEFLFRGGGALVAGLGFGAVVAVLAVALARATAGSPGFVGFALVHVAGVTATVALTFWVSFVGPF